MNRAERIRLIKEAAESLAGRNYDDIQLILDQFGLSTYDPQETLAEYCINRVSQLRDGDLAELHDYLLGEDAAPGPQQTTARPWGTNPVAVFISHVHEDAPFASRVRDRLVKSYGIDAFVAHNDISPSKKWRDTIRSALASCHFMVAILHERFHASQWCDQEVGWALGRNVPVLPVRLATPTERRDGFLEEHQEVMIDAGRMGSDDHLADKIFEAVLSDSRTHAVGVKALAEAIVHSPSYARTRRLWSDIAAVEDWDGQQLRRLEYAARTNRQVYEANVDGVLVPELVERLVRKFEPPPPPDPWATSAGVPF